MYDNWRKRAYVLTGGFASGKSTASKILRKLGAELICADDLAHRAVEPGSPTYKKIVDYFTETILFKDGSINRKALGELVFADPEKRNTLEKIVHPEVRRLAAQEAGKLGNPLFYDCPLYFESDLKGFKKVILISSEQEKCIERAMQRDDLSREEVLKRINSQMPLAEKEQLADIVVYNNGSVEDLESALRGLEL